MDSFRNDPTWVADYQAALASLENKHPTVEPQLLLEAQRADRRCPPFQPITKPEHPFDPDNLADVLSVLVIKRTVNPVVRDVFYRGELIGQIAKSPWTAMVWICSADRRTLFYSQKDAALMLVLKARQREDENAYACERLYDRRIGGQA